MLYSLNYCLPSQILSSRIHSTFWGMIGTEHHNCLCWLSLLSAVWSSVRHPSAPPGPPVMEHQGTSSALYPFCLWSVLCWPSVPLPSSYTAFTSPCFIQWDPFPYSKLYKIVIFDKTLTYISSLLMTRKKS